MQQIPHVSEIMQAAIQIAGDARITGPDDDAGSVDPVVNHMRGNQPATDLPSEIIGQGAGGAASIERMVCDERNSSDAKAAASLTSAGLSGGRGRVNDEAGLWASSIKAIPALVRIGGVKPVRHTLCDLDP